MNIKGKDDSAKEEDDSVEALIAKLNQKGNKVKILKDEDDGNG